jgi:hypothetical protein
MATFPAAMLTRIRGTKYGLSLCGPLDLRVSAAAATSSIDPIPEPMAQPARVGSYAPSLSPLAKEWSSADRSASCAHAMAIRVNRLIRRASAPGMVAGSKPFTRPPTRDERAASGPVSEVPTTVESRAVIPLSPRISAAQLDAVSSPSGVTIP